MNMMGTHQGFLRALSGSVVGVVLAAGLWVSSASLAVAAEPACAPLLQHTVPRLQDDVPQSLCQYQRQVIVVVNTASFCGFTPQYKGLEALYETYKDRGLVVLGFPSNDFFQESESAKRIVDFCEGTFGIRFPMFAKTAVKGAAAIPFYRQLAQRTGKAPAWNFHKYIIGRDGSSVSSFASDIEPQSPAFIREVEKQLARP